MSTRLIKFVNNARSTLDGGIVAGSTSLSVQSGHGARFPSLTGSEYFYATLDDGSGVIEIIKVTARTGDSFGTIARAQEGTTAVAWGDLSSIQVRLTEDGMQQFVGEGQEHTSRTDLPTNSVADQGITYAVGNDRRVTLDGSGDTSQDLFHMDENGLVLRPGAGYAELDGTVAHDWSALAAPEIPETVVITPTATRIITLPTTKVPIGWDITIINLATDQLLTIAASGGATIRQVFPGHKVTFVARVKPPTTAAHWWSSSGLWHLDLTAVTLGAVTSGTLIAYTLPANSLIEDGGVFRVTHWGTRSGTTASTTLYHRLGGVNGNSLAFQGSINTWKLEALITRAGANVQKVFVDSVNSGGAGWTGSSSNIQGGIEEVWDEHTETETADIVIDINVATKNASDTLVQKGMLVEKVA